MKKRVGLIVDSFCVSNQVLDLVRLSKESESYEITTLLINDIERGSGSLVTRIASHISLRGLSDLLPNLFFRFVCKVESFFVRRNIKYSNLYSRFYLQESGFNIIKVNPKVSKNGLVCRYGEEDIRSVGELNLDSLVYFGGSVLRGDILKVCPNGVILFQYGDNEGRRVGPPGFWEVYERQPRTGFTIKRLKDDGGECDVLYSGYIATSWLYSFNLANLCEISSPFLHQVIGCISFEEIKLKPYKKNVCGQSVRSSPSFIKTVMYLFKVIFLISIKVAMRVQGKTFRWGVAYQFSESWSGVSLWCSNKIPNPKNRFLADPFVVKKDDCHFCFVEDYDFKVNKGSISAYKISAKGYERLGVVLEEDFHLSYPFIFDYEDEVYMCPETHEKNQIRVYKCIDFPNKWEFYKTLMSNVSASDTNIFKYNGRWWLFTNIDRSAVLDHSCQLYIFYSDSPLASEWHAHDRNPVIFDSAIARNGGMIFSDNEVYRVFQRQGFDMYGEACGIAKIVDLSVADYREEVCKIVEPDFFKKIRGTHTYNFDSNLVVFDYVEVSKKTTGV